MRRSAWDDIRDVDTRSPLTLLSHASSAAQKLQSKKELYHAYEQAKKSNGLVSLQLSNHEVHVTSHVRKKHHKHENENQSDSPIYSLEARIEHMMKREKHKHKEKKENRHMRNRHPRHRDSSSDISLSNIKNDSYVPRTRRGRLAVAASHGNKVLSASPSFGLDDISSDEDSPRKNDVSATVSEAAPLSSTQRFAQRTHKIKRHHHHRARRDSTDSNMSHESSKSTAAEETPTKQNYKSIITKNNELISMLQSQLLSNGVKPILEVVTYETAEIRLKEALQRLMDGDETAEEVFNQWDEYIRNHPQYKENKEKERILWIRNNDKINEYCLSVIRSLIPPDIIKSSLNCLADQLPNPVAKRLWSKKALWLTRIPREKIAKLHVADLQTKYSVQGLDEVELRAIWACLPEKFDNDATKGKENWKLSLLQTLQTKHSASVPSYPVEEADMAGYDSAIAQYVARVVRNPAYRQLTDTFGPFDRLEVFIEEEPVPVVLDVLVDRVVGKLPTRRHSVATPSRDAIIKQLSACSEIGEMDAMKLPDMTSAIESHISAITTPERMIRKQQHQQEDKKPKPIAMNPKLGGVASVLSEILAKAKARPS